MRGCQDRVQGGERPGSGDVSRPQRGESQPGHVVVVTVAPAAAVAQADGAQQAAGARAVADAVVVLTGVGAFPLCGVEQAVEVVRLPPVVPGCAGPAREAHLRQMGAGEAEQPATEGAGD